MSTRYFDDIEVGEVLKSGPYAMSRAEIVEFAGRYDPRPFHLDEAAGGRSVFGGLVASGIHTIAVWNRLRLDAEGGLEMLAGLGFDELRYAVPVRPGDRLSLTATCIEKEASSTKPDRGVMRFHQSLRNQDGEEVMTLVVTLLVARRPAGTAGDAVHSGA